MKDRTTIRVQKIDGEWQAVVRINGQIDEMRTYYTLGGDKEHKKDAEDTAKLMLLELSRPSDESFVVESITRKEIFRRLEQTLELEDLGKVEFKLRDLSKELCQEYARRLGQIDRVIGEDGYWDAVSEINQAIISELGIALDEGGK